MYGYRVSYYDVKQWISLDRNSQHTGFNEILHNDVFVELVLV